LVFKVTMPAIDWFQTFLTPWIHYIPVATDLSDLEKLWEWAEAHPQHAQRIAAAGAEIGADTPPGLASKDFAAALEAAKVPAIREDGLSRRLSHCHYGACADGDVQVNDCRDLDK
jgi:ABC-type nitrate/sulfonate/bicarbonate transport system substrate-binding protein